MNSTKVEGKNIGTIVLYGLSTCIWCKKTIEFLQSQNVEYEYVFVDQLETAEKDEAKELIKKWNPSCSYPTLIINNKECIVGFDEDAIKKELLL